MDVLRILEAGWPLLRPILISALAQEIVKWAASHKVTLSKEDADKLTLSIVEGVEGLIASRTKDLEQG